MNHRSLTAEAEAQFRDGISLVLSRWAALRMAIENEWGGRDSTQKSQQLADNLFNLLTRSKEQVYIDTEIGDGSIEEEQALFLFSCFFLWGMSCLTDSCRLGSPMMEKIIVLNSMHVKFILQK